MKLPADVRASHILEAAIRVANRHGLLRATWNAVAAECGVETSERTVRAYFKNYTTLWQTIIADGRFKGDRMGVSDAKD